MVVVQKQRSTSRTGLILLTAALLCLSASPAQSRDVVLFQPGQSSWEWLLVPTSHEGGKRMREGKTCLFCHENEEKIIGKLITSGEKLEPSPIAGLADFIEMTVDASFDEENLYLKMTWTTPPLASQSGPAGHEEAATHLTVMLGSPQLNVSAIAGCWAACHNDLPHMPDALTGDELTKYLPGSRQKMSKTGGGNDLRPEAELTAQINEGKYLEYWQVKMDQDQLIAVTDGYFLQERMANDDSAVTATLSSSGQNRTVEMVRPLKAAGGPRHKLSEAVEYTLAVALHENHASGRFHYTSFPMRFVLGAGEAELTAVPVNR